jgi:hypothetical protein
MVTVNTSGRPETLTIVKHSSGQNDRAYAGVFGLGYVDDFVSA